MKTWETTRRGDRITVWSTDHREGWPTMTQRAVEMLKHDETLHRDGIDHGHVYRFTVKSVEPTTSCQHCGARGHFDERIKP